MNIEEELEKWDLLNKIHYIEGVLDALDTHMEPRESFAKCSDYLDDLKNFLESNITIYKEKEITKESEKVERDMPF